MLGNFSFGGYFKERAIQLAYEFIINELKLEIDYVTVFSPDKVAENDWRKNIPEDIESYQIWKSVGLSEDKIRKEGIDNFWGPTGEEGPCGATTEIYVNGIEVWNLVFNEYFCNNKKELRKIDSPGIDTGSGLERLTTVVQKKKNVFETDLFSSLIKEIPINDQRVQKIIADHIRSCVFLISEGILPSNKDRGYILRRLIRRVIGLEKKFNIPADFILKLIPKIIDSYKSFYPEIDQEKEIIDVVEGEINKFEKSLEKGLSYFQKTIKSDSKLIDGNEAFNIYQNYGFPLDLIEELAKEKNLEVDKKGFQDALEKHQEISRAGAEKKFGGVGKEASQNAIKLHTATHLLHKALRTILGEHVQQSGSDINEERLRFDFSHKEKLTEEEIKKVEDLINQKIKEDLEIKKEEMPYEEAIKTGALAFFKEKYPDIVNVYSIGDFSKEICGGPHINRTSELNNFKIIKEESSGSGIRRIKAVLN
jgi:alanyl-tRNA synthetase